MPQRKFCPHCNSYMLDIVSQTLIEWKKCPTCSYCEDREGYNLMNPKPKDAELDSKSTVSETKCYIPEYAYQCANCTCGGKDD